MSIKQKKSIGLSITHTANLLNNTINKVLKPFDIAIEQRAILEIIHFQKEIKQTDLCNILEKDRTTVSRTLKTLEAKKYIKRVKIDNKIQIVKLSTLGEKIFSKTKTIVEDHRSRINNEFSEDEIKNLYDYLARINNIMEENNSSF